jgi:hypothetical protein
MQVESKKKRLNEGIRKCVCERERERERKEIVKLIKLRATKLNPFAGMLMHQLFFGRYFLMCHFNL